MPPSCCDTRTETRIRHSPPNGIVNDALIESLPLLLDTVAQLFDIPHLLPVNSFLHHYPDFVVHRVQIRAVGRPESRLNEIRSLTELSAVCVVIDASFFRLMIQTGFLSYADYDLVDLLQYNWPTTVQMFV
jgi:hypothetical protein